RSKMEPLSPERYALQTTVGKNTYDKLRRIQELLSHRIPPGDLESVLDYMVNTTLRHLERRKFGATSHPRSSQPSSTNPRQSPAAVRRAVEERDQGQCTFLSETGRRCSSRGRLEFDHIVPVARGGQATVDNLRLRCRTHNQYAAECEFGSEFMKNKRELARN